MRECLPVRSYITMSIIFVKLWPWLGPPLAALRCVAICYVFPVLFITSCLPTVYQAYALQVGRLSVLKMTHQVAAPDLGEI